MCRDFAFSHFLVPTRPSAGSETRAERGNVGRRVLSAVWACGDADPREDSRDYFAGPSAGSETRAELGRCGPPSPLGGRGVRGC